MSRIGELEEKVLKGTATKREADEYVRLTRTAEAAIAARAHAPSRFEEGAAEVIGIEGGTDPQSLWVRVGPIYGDGPDPVGRGVWITYQKHHMDGELTGPVLLSIETWRALAAAVEQRIRR